MTKRKRAYDKYLESKHWRDLREQAFARDEYKCRQCGTGKGLQGHHLKYRWRLEDCTVKDIVTLCEKCHYALHRKKSRDRKKRRRLARHLRELILEFSATDL